MNSMIKKIVAVMAAVVMAVTAAVSVSADFATVDKYGFFYYNGNSVTQINVGDTIPLNKNPYSARWSVSGLSPDYTYDIFLDILTDSAIDFTKLSTTGSGSDTHVYYSINNPNLWYNTTTTSSWTLLSGVNGSIEKISDKHVKFHIFYNYNLSGLKYSSLQLCMNFAAIAGGISNLKVVSQGCGAYYDPGGDTYSQLIYEYGAGNPLPDVKDIKDQGNAMSSAEAAVRDKSSDLVSSVDSEWSVYQTDAKALATTLKPAATQINNLYATITAELPDEVKALFIAIPILLFIGWLIGRVRE